MQINGVKVNEKIEALSHILVMFCSTGMTLMIGMNSKLHPFANGISEPDSSVFRYIGLLMKEGYVPYRDSFDHKGILLYFIEWIGYLFPERYGIWCIEIVFLGGAFYPIN